MPNAVVKIGFLGLGVVGAELLNIIRSNQARILDKYGVKLEVSKIFVRDLNKKRDTDTSELQLTTNAADIIFDKDIHIVCECMGGAGTENTKEFVISALENSKSVVMSSKKVLALYGKKILDLASSSSAQLRFDATVGGGIPVAKILKECFKGEKVEKIVGILNATSNFIYTKMEKDNLSFEDALKKAQQLGYAENDPSEDINGFDALYKSIILTMFSMKKWLNIKELSTTPIGNITVLDMKYANELGYKIKPLVIMENQDDKLKYRVGPCLINENHIAANTVENYNIIVFKGSNTGVLGFYGQGAGSKPTASAMFDDLISIATTPDEGISGLIKEMYSGVEPTENVYEYKNNLYWRVSVENIVGKLAFICSLLADNSVNIEKVIQKDEAEGKIGVVLLTSRVDSSTLSKIVDQFTNNDIEINTIIPFLGE
ncbi:MAG: homoserine dehydrogenase [Clostridia bacterium]|nr:homoserine dehydrogenase [Clostridia bacterium]